jgi:hypothetical protein
MRAQIMEQGKYSILLGKFERYSVLPAQPGSGDGAAQISLVDVKVPLLSLPSSLSPSISPPPPLSPSSTSMFRCFSRAGCSHLSVTKAPRIRCDRVRPARERERAHSLIS